MPPKSPKAPTGTRVYILTQNGENKRITVHHDVAEGWLGLGNDFDYQIMYLDDNVEPAPPPQTPSPEARESQRSRDLADKARAVTQDIQRQSEKFKNRLLK